MRPLISLLLTLTCVPLINAQDAFIPRRQSKPPGPPQSPQAAIEKMVVPPGFHVELVASEPQIMNPVAMAFDDAGRIYVTESFEYPRREPGPGRDRIKILEDTDGDGRIDNVKIFADGLNIPSGIAIGHGGVWVANAPDILFLEDTDGDDRADRQTVIATGFGRDDTHELPNALTWGPDGYLYGLNGVFNRSAVQQAGKRFEFTCAMFRIHPITHQFELFSEGTSNPWGIAFNDEGSAFISACVIDHLWHLAESGYYHRQAGAYPPHTWKIDSIVDYKHQMAAYCGIEYFDSPAYPAEYRGKLYMGNIHGGCINVDSVTRKGSTYQGQPHPDFLTANDVWFMPVAQKTGPDGCLYILDWYDRYHCYQDANADPQGVDRGHGRLYRVVHNQRPQPTHADLRKLSSAQLLQLLKDPNVFYRRRANVILHERLHSSTNDTDLQAIVDTLFQSFARASAAQLDAAEHFPLYSLTTLLYAPQTSDEQLRTLLQHPHPLVAAWTTRAVATRPTPTKDMARATQRTAVQSLAQHNDPRVRLQVAIAANKIAGEDAPQWLLEVLRHSQDDGLLPRIVWRNLEPHVLSDQATIVDAIAAATDGSSSSGSDDSDTLVRALAPRIAQRLAADVKRQLNGPRDPQTLASILQIADALSRAGDQNAATTILTQLVDRLQRGEWLASAAQPVLSKLAPLQPDANFTLVDSPAGIQLRAFAGQPEALHQIGTRAFDTRQPITQRLAMLATAARLQPSLLTTALQQWHKASKTDSPANPQWRDTLFDLAARYGDPACQTLLLEALPKLPVARSAAITSTLCQRRDTADRLLTAIAEGKLNRDLVGPNQVRALATSNWDTVQGKVEQIWGSVRQQDSAQRRQVVAEMTRFLNQQARGDATRGWKVWDRVCGQCHVLHGRGLEVGPNLTRNGRGSFEQLVVSVFDPSLVIGNAYQATSVLTVDGRVLNGIVTERSDNRVVLRVQGGKTEVIPVEEIEREQQSPNSLMPEGLETQISRQELADLFALLSLEQPPESDDNEVIAGTPNQLHESP